MKIGLSHRFHGADLARQAERAFYRLWFRPALAPRTLLVLRLDALGDYILFRNFLPCLRQEGPFKGWNITLLGNLAWRTVAERWDSACVDHFAWTNPSQLRRRWVHRRLSVRTWSRRGFDTLLAPIHSREWFMDDLATTIPARCRLASAGDRFNQRDRVGHSDPYDQRLSCGPAHAFEFERNRYLMEVLLGRSLSHVSLSLPEPTWTLASPPAGGYVLLVPGAGRTYRRWPTDSFARLAQELTETWGQSVVLAGGPAEHPLGTQIQSAAPRVRNLIGHTTTDQFIELIGHSHLVIANESSAVHVAVALNRPVVCITNTILFGRFHPYPPALGPQVTHLYPPSVEARRDDHAGLVRDYGGRRTLDLATVTVERVLAVTRERLGR